MALIFTKSADKKITENLETLYFSLREQTPHSDFSGPHFPTFYLNTKIFKVMQGNTDQKISHKDTFCAAFLYIPH